MLNVFMSIVNMNITACWAILIVICLRMLIKKVSKEIAFLLWIPVGLRLICPITLPSIFRIISRESAMLMQVEQISDSVIKAGMVTVATNNQGNSAAGIPICQIFMLIWLFGVLGLFAYMIISTWRMNVRVRRTANLMYDNVYRLPWKGSAFVFGLIRPRIYLSDKLDGEQVGHIILHEQAHITRKDHWWKMIGFTILMLHWFNPVVWLAYMLLCKDMEFACDERVIRKMNRQEKARYSESLLQCSINLKGGSIMSVAFSKGCIKRRIRSICQHKRPAKWIACVTAMIVVLVCVILLTGTTQAQQDMSGSAVLSNQMVINENANSVTDVAPEPEDGIPAFWRADPPETFEDVIDHYASVWGVSEHQTGPYFHSYKIICQQQTDTYAIAYIAHCSVYYRDGKNAELPQMYYLKITSEIKDGVYFNCNVTSNNNDQMLEEIRQECQVNIDDENALWDKLASQCYAVINETRQNHSNVLNANEFLGYSIG